VTAMSHASLSSKRKSKRESKINIKSEKLNKRKEKLSVSKAFHNTEADGVQNGYTSRNNYGNGKGAIKWVLASRKQSLG